MIIINSSHLCFFKGTGRTRLNSESHAYSVSRDEELQARGEDEVGTPTEGAPFRGRSKSAPPALWAAKKYGRQLRRMSDEFDSMLDKGVRARGQRVEVHLQLYLKMWGITAKKKYRFNISKD